MTKKLCVLLILFVIVLQACNKDEISNGVKKVKSFDKVAVDGDIVLEVKKSESAGAETELKIISSPDFYSKITATSENGLVTINATDDVTFDKNIVVQVEVPALTSIKLENTQHASIIFLGEFHIPTIDIVTEAESKLELYNLQADNITSRQEGESELILTSAMEPVKGPLSFTGNVVMVDDTTILVNDKVLVTGTAIEVNTSVTPHAYTVVGTAIKQFYLTETGNFVTQGTANIVASDLFVKTLDIKLEGESTASVWVKELLKGKGEGSSILTYKGSPAMQYLLSGSAKVFKY